MTFERPDPDKFEGFALAYEAARRSGNMPTVFNAANERAVALFLEHKINFTDIPRLIKAAMDNASFIASPSVDDIIATGKSAEEYVEQYLMNGMR